jgi:hypothetical protein
VAGTHRGAGTGRIGAGGQATARADMAVSAAALLFLKPNSKLAFGLSRAGARDEVRGRGPMPRGRGRGRGGGGGGLAGRL